MTSFVRDESVVVAAPPEAVYDYVSDICRHAEWAGDKLQVREVSHGRYESIVDLGMKVPATITVDVADRPRRFAYVCDDSLSGLYRWTFTLAAAGDGTKLTHRVERLRGPLLVRLIQPWAMWPVVGRPSTRRGLENIRRHFEATAVGATQRSSSATDST